METKSGIIIRLVKNKGYGFIRQDDNTDVFFHNIGVISPAFEDLREGLPVEYMIAEDPHKKLSRAIGVVTK